ESNLSEADRLCHALVILDEAITKLRPDFFWLGGLKSSFKVSTFHMKYSIL
ncbi:unnamed protein product, partial [Brassica rapa subsp. trilocularis]